MASVLVEHIVEQQAPIADDEESFPLYVEFFIVFFLIVAFSLWGRRCPPTPPRHKKGKLEDSFEVKSTPRCKAIEEAGNSNDHKKVLDIWEASDKKALSQVSLPHVVTAYLNEEPGKLLDELTELLTMHTWMRETQCLTGVVEQVAASVNVEVMEGLVRFIDGRSDIRMSYQMQELLAGAYAHAGLVDKMEECLAVISSSDRKASARCRCTVLRGLLHSKNADAALRSAKEMKTLGYTISPYLVTDIYRVFCKAGRGADVLRLALPEIPPSSHASVMLLEHCLEKKDASLAKDFQAAFKREGTELCSRSHETMLKILVGCGDADAYELFEQIKGSSAPMSEGFCMGLLTKCAESKLLKFADQVVEHVRATSGMTIALHSAYMKVYAVCDMHDKACDLFEEMRSQGMQPDGAMLSLVAWYAAECGRHELSKQLAEQSPQLRTHRWMSSIRSCVKDKDVRKACEYLRQSLDVGCKDAMIFNCALDVCAAAGDVDKARVLLSTMQKQSKPDLVTYNTVLKCYATKGDLRGAKKMLQEMEDAGFAPNEVSYNVIINLAVTYGSFRSAWDTIELMTSKGNSVDCYTISTLLKAVKKSNSQQDLAKIFALMDRLQIDVSSDEVLMNCVLEMCMKHSQIPRLQEILNKYSLHSMKPAPHTYAVLFRACSVLKDLKRCFSLWDEMVNIRGIDANKATLLAMVETLCAAGRGASACELLEQWKDKVPPTMAMYQALPKGFPKAEGSLALLRELRKTKMTMTTMLYNLLIDAQAKAGQMQDFSQLVDMMAEDGCKPDNFTLSLQVKGYCYGGELKKAYGIFEAARESNLKADTVAFNTLLDGCIRHNDYTLADQLVTNIEQYGVVPSNFTVGTIIKMWGRRRQLDKCFETADEFCTKFNIVPTGPVRACLMSACVLNKDVDRALMVFEKIRSGGETLDARALGSIISLCLRSGRLQDAIKLTDEVGGAFVTKEIGGEFLDQLAVALAKEGKLESIGVPLFRKLQHRGVDVMASGQVTSVLTRGSR